MSEREATNMRRRDLLALIGTAAGGAVMYRAMTSLGLAAESTYAGRSGSTAIPRAPRCSSWAPGSPAWWRRSSCARPATGCRCSNTATAPAGAAGRCAAATPTPSSAARRSTASSIRASISIPARGAFPTITARCSTIARASRSRSSRSSRSTPTPGSIPRKAFGGKPQRYRHVQADFNGYIAELLAKATSQRKLDEAVTREDQEILLQALRGWGALDRELRLQGEPRAPATGAASTRIRAAGSPVRRFPRSRSGSTISCKSGLWQGLLPGANYEFQTTLFQPVGGMDMIARAFAREVGDLIRFNAKVKAIRQDARGVSAWSTRTPPIPASRSPRPPTGASAPFRCSILSQIELNVGAPMQNAIGAVPYAPALKVGLQFRRRFWEQDEGIYGGISYTDLPIRLIGYPCTGYGGAGKAVLLGAYTIFSVYAYEFTSLSPAERVAKAVADGAQIHPQYKEEFENGIAVAWHRNPAVLGCSGTWTDATREQHYDNLCALDGRILLAGEHASYLPGWQEGALLSSLDAIGRLHRRVLARLSREATGDGPDDRLAALLALARWRLRARRRPCGRGDPGRMAQSADARFANPARFMAATGEALYADICQGCHMPGGVGAVGAGAYPALARNPKLASPGYPLTLVVNGRNGMPPFGEPVDRSAGGRGGQLCPHPFRQ